MALNFLNQLFSSPEFQQRLASERGFSLPGMEGGDNALMGGVPAQAQGQIDSMPMQQGNGLAQPLMAQMPQMQQQMQGLQQTPMPQQPMQPPHHGGLSLGSTFGNILGKIGDALLISSGHQPIYQGRLQEQQAKEALGGFFDNPDQALKNYLQVDPEGAIKFWLEQRKAAAEEKRASRESNPAFIQELTALGIDPHSPDAKDLFYGKNSPAGYLLRPPQQVQAPSQNLPVITSQEQYNALPPGTPYQNERGERGIKRGGASPSGSRTFR